MSSWIDRVKTETSQSSTGHRELMRGICKDQECHFSLKRLHKSLLFLLSRPLSMMVTRAVTRMWAVVVIVLLLPSILVSGSDYISKGGSGNKVPVWQKNTPAIPFTDRARSWSPNYHVLAVWLWASHLTGPPTKGGWWLQISHVVVVSNEVIYEKTFCKMESTEQITTTGQFSREMILCT